MSNVHTKGKRSSVYHLKDDIQMINSILQSNINIRSKCSNMWPHIDNICVYESFVNPENPSTKKNNSIKLDFLTDKMKEFNVLDSKNVTHWDDLNADQALIIYALFVDIFYGVM